MNYYQILNVDINSSTKEIKKHYYKLALKCGSNMIRIGSKIFGERNYQ